MMIKDLPLVLVQIDILWEQIGVNLKRAKELIEQDPIPEGSLIIFPECFAHGFLANLEECEKHFSQILVFLKDTAQFYASWVIGGVATREGNLALLIDPQGEWIDTYQKIHLFSLVHEDRLYSAGQEIKIWEMNGWKVMPTICYDLRFPELYRWGAKKGVDLFLCLANWPKKRVGHWVTLLKARAIENLSYVAGVNRSGEDPKEVYPGYSQVEDPWGNDLLEWRDEAYCFHCQLSKEKLKEVRRQFPALGEFQRSSWEVEYRILEGGRM